MYLSENKMLRLFTLCGLYVVQGIPWGFVAVALKAWLAGEPHRLSEGQLGDLIAYATLPWSFKWVWGFVVDSYQTSSFGKRRPWLILAQLAMLVSLGSIAFITDPSGNFGGLLQLVLIANICVGLQDVSVDAMAVDLLTDEDRERVSGLMYAGSYLGTAIGGAGLGWVIGQYGIQSAILCQCVLLCISILIPVLIRERPGDRFFPGQRTNSSQVVGAVVERSSAQLAKDVFKAFRLRSTLLGAAVALSVKLGYGVVSPSFTTYLRNAAGWSVEYYTGIEGFWGSLAGILACCVGAFAAQRFGAKHVTAVGLIALSVMWIAMGVRPEWLANHVIAATVLVGQEAFIALFSAGLFAIYCAISWPRVAAIQFTGYMAMLNASHTIGSKLAGLVSASLDLSQLFILAGGLQIVIVAGVYLINLRETRTVLGVA